MIDETRDQREDVYLSYDVAVTHAATQWVIAGIKSSNQEQIYDLDVACAKVGRQMASLGVCTDIEKRRAFAHEYQGTADRLRKEFIEVCEWKPKPGVDPNPASYPQVARLLYDEFGLPVLGTTDTGAPSTGESVLLELLGSGVDDRARRTIHALLGWREVDKLQGTYVGRERPNNDDQEAKYNPQLKLYGGLPIHPDGRIRCTWKVYGTMSGRWSSSPNMQNIPKKLRAMFVAPPGYVLVGADYSALELRLQALEAGDRILIPAFAAFDSGTGPDVHKVNTCTIFGITLEQLEAKGPDGVQKARDFGKRYVYAGQYGAGDKRIFQTLSLLRDDDFNPVFPGLTLSSIEATTKVWWAAHPEIVKWRKDVIAMWRRNGFVEELATYRRRHFIGGEDPEEMWSHRIQGRAAGMQNTAILKFATAYPHWGDRGLIINGHDQQVAVAKEDEADDVKKTMAWSMDTTIGPMRFPAEAKIGHSWKDVS